jgi:hypothetical protein
MKQQVMLEDKEIKRLMKLSGTGKYSKKVLSEKKEREMKEQQIDEGDSCEVQEEETVDETIDPGNGKVETGNHDGSGPDQKTPGNIAGKAKKVPIKTNNNTGDLKPAKQPDSDAPVKLPAKGKAKINESAKLDKEIERLLREIDELEDDETDVGPEGGDLGSDPSMDEPDVDGTDAPQTDGSEKSALKDFCKKLHKLLRNHLELKSKLKIQKVWVIWKVMKWLHQKVIWVLIH